MDAQRSIYPQRVRKKSVRLLESKLMRKSTVTGGIAKLFNKSTGQHNRILS